MDSVQDVSVQDGVILLWRPRVRTPEPAKEMGRFTCVYCHCIYLPVYSLHLFSPTKGLFEGTMRGLDVSPQPLQNTTLGSTPMFSAIISFNCRPVGSLHVWFSAATASASALFRGLHHPPRQRGRLLTQREPNDGCRSTRVDRRSPDRWSHR